MTTVPVIKPSEVGTPSTQETRLVVDPANGNTLTRISQIAGIGRQSIPIELNLPIIAASSFGTTDLPLPPTGRIYYFADSDNSNSPTMINAAGTKIVLATGGGSVNGLQIASNSLLSFGDNHKYITYSSTSGKLSFTNTDVAGTTEIFAANLSIGSGTDLLGFFGIAPAVQQSVPAAAPVLLADCIDQINQIKTVLVNLGLAKSV